MYGQTEAGPRMSILNWKMFYKNLIVSVTLLKIIN